MKLHQTEDTKGFGDINFVFPKMIWAGFRLTFLSIYSADNNKFIIYKFNSIFEFFSLQKIHHAAFAIRIGNIPSDVSLHGAYCEPLRDLGILQLANEMYSFLKSTPQFNYKHEFNKRNTDFTIKS